MTNDLMTDFLTMLDKKLKKKKRNLLLFIDNAVSDSSAAKLI